MSTRSFSDLLIDLQNSLTGDKISLADLLEIFHERGFGFILLILSAPLIVPLPPGIGSILSVPLILLTVQQAAGSHSIWLPRRITRKTIDARALRDVVGKILPWARRIERFLKPRLDFITQGWFSHAIGVFGFLMAVCIALPIPLGNNVPALGIALMSLGVIARDGFSVLIGASIGLCWMALLAFAGQAGFSFLTSLF